MKYSIIRMLREAQTQEEGEHAAKEVIKRGVLRAGNSGVILPGGIPSGGCPRLAHLRSQGMDADPATGDRRIMFGGGISNETYWYNILDRVWKEGPILREEEIPISWETSNGTRVTGRPDIVLCRDDQEGTLNHPKLGTPLTPVLGLELKMVAAFGTVRTVLLEGQPKMNHLAQAAHYSWQLGIPFKLVYTSYVDHSVPAWGMQFCPKKGQLGSERLKYNDRGNPLKILPFVISYELQWGPDYNPVLQYKLEGDRSWQDSLISREGLAAYYEVVAGMGPSGQLPPRPATLKANGTKEGYTSCAYCPLNEVCGVTNYNDWMTGVQSLIKTRETAA